MTHAMPELNRPPSAAISNVSWTEERDLPGVLQRVRPFTMVPTPALTELARQVRTVLDGGIPGDFVECGTWRGGSSFLMADLLRLSGVSGRKVWMFDSFEGIPPPEEIDGVAAKAWAENKDSPWYHDNLRVSLEDVQRSAAALGLAERTMMVKGYFEKTLSAHRERVGPIALLRIDADWHASVKCCLDQLYDQVVDGGLVVFDDYFAYDGCAIAVHEFLGARGLGHRIETIGSGPHAPQMVFCKGRKTWRWLHETYLLNQELAALLPGDARFILVDDEALRIDLVERARVVPFLERDGVYWGAPADDAVAIAELARLRALGLRHIVFTWPSFWWLEQYREFAGCLRERHRCVHESERSVVFELSSED